MLLPRFILLDPALPQKGHWNFNHNLATQHQRFIFGSDRSPVNANLRSFVRLSDEKCSRAHNLNLSLSCQSQVSPFSSMHISSLEWSFAKIQKPQIISLALDSHRKRTHVNITSGQAKAVQKGPPSEEFLQIWRKFLICLQTLVSQAWSGVLQKFKT